MNSEKGEPHAPPAPSDRQAEKAQEGARPGPRFSLRRLAPLLVLLVAVAVFFALGLDKHVSFEALRDNRAELLAFVGESTAIAVLLYAAIYAAATALSLPWGTLLTIGGGFLFGPVLGSALTVVAATVGAIVVFYVAKTALGDPLRARAHRTLRSGAVQRIEAGFQANALSYMLFLRLAPIFPFVAVNLIPAFLGVTPRVYAIGTFFGIIPGTVVYALVGSGLGSVFDRNEAFSLEGILTPEVSAALVGLALLAMIPVAYKLVRRRRA